MSKKPVILDLPELEQKMIGRNIQHISRETGISTGTLYEIARGERRSRDIMLGIAKKLSAYFEEH